MDDMTVCHFLVESNGNLTELDKVKLSGRVTGHNGCVSWAGNAMAIINGTIWNEKNRNILGVTKKTDP